MSVRDELLKWRTEMNGLIFERNAETNGLLLALLSRKHICMVGPGGTSKSLLGRLMALMLEDAKFGDLQFSKHTVPDEVFGPPSIAALKEGHFLRVTKNRLPESVIYLGDELFEGNSAILNGIRKILNERLFENNGENQKVPLEVFIAATNLIPTDETLAAMYDRLHLRYHVKYLSEPAHFLAMLEGPKSFDDFAAKVTARVTLDQLHGAQEEARHVVIPRPVANAMWQVRSQLAPLGIIPSDRRWNEAYEIVRAKTWLQGRTEAQMDDLSVLTDLLWNDPQHKKHVQGVVLEIANPLLKVADTQRDGVEQAFANIQKLTEKKEKMLAAAESLSKANDALKKLQEVLEQGQKAAMDMTAVEEHITAVERIQDLLQTDYLGLKKRAK